MAQQCPDTRIKVVMPGDNLYIHTGQIRSVTRWWNPLSKRVWVRIERHNTQVTLREVHDKIRQIQKEHPDLDVFWDGDEYAICSREKTRPPEEGEEGELIDQVK
jgi:hypothetical protein